MRKIQIETIIITHISKDRMKCENYGAQNLNVTEQSKGHLSE